MVGPGSARYFVVTGLASEARRDLRWFGRNENRRAHPSLKWAQPLAYALFDQMRIHVAGDGDDEIVRAIVPVEEAEQVFARGLQEHFLIADHRMSIWMNTERGVPEQLAEFAAGIVAAHGHFLQDDDLLAFPFVFRKRRVHDGIAENLEPHFPVGCRQDNMEDGAIEGGVGVDASAGGIELPGDFACAAGGRALEDHVLDIMGEAGAEVLVFMNGAGAEPELDGGDGGRRILLHHTGDAVVHGEAMNPVIGIAEHFGRRVGQGEEWKTERNGEEQGVGASDHVSPSVRPLRRGWCGDGGSRIADGGGRGG